MSVLQLMATRGAGAAAWTPANLSNKVGWWRASDITGKNNGDSNTAWPDSFGLLSDATGTGTYRDSANGIGGQPAIELSLSSHGYATNYTGIMGDFLAWVVFSWSGTPSNAKRLLDKVNPTGFWMGYLSGGFGGGIRETSAPFGLFLTAGASPQYLIFGRSGTTRYVYHAGVTTNNTVVSTATDTSQLTIGYQAGVSANTWVGKIAEAGILSGWESPANILSYITNNYGITTS